jgi:hypothetical protein
MGGNAASDRDRANARVLGRLIAGEGMVLLNGAGPGIMEESARGAKERSGTTVGITSSADRRAANRYIDVSIATGIADGRNFYNVLSSDVVVAMPGSAGTFSEIALALKAGKQVVILDQPQLRSVLLPKYEGQAHFVDSPGKAVKKARELLGSD